MRKFLLSLLFFPFVAVALVSCTPLFLLSMVFPDESDEWLNED